MSKKYDEYLEEHIANVGKAADWFKENIPLLMSDEILNDIKSNHDWSKKLDDEYKAYDDYFYGNKSYDVVNKFDYAWLSHIHRNPHHWQHWVLRTDEEGIKPLEIPYRYVIEMICDWWSFSWKSGDLSEIFDWYDSHWDSMILHANTRKIIEIILQSMRSIIEPTSDKGSERELLEYINKDINELYKYKDSVKNAINATYGLKTDDSDK